MQNNFCTESNRRQHMRDKNELKPFLLEFMNDLLIDQPVNVLEYMISWSAQKMQKEEHNLIENGNIITISEQQETLQHRVIEKEHEEVLCSQIERIINDFNELANDYIDHFKGYADGARDRYMLELEDSFYGIEELRVLEDDMHMHRAKLFEVIDIVKKGKESLEEFKQENISNTQKLNIMRNFYETEKAKFHLLGDIHPPHVH